MTSPGRYILDVGAGECVVLPAKLVALINSQLASWRVQVRGRNPELDAALLDIARVAMTVASGRGQLPPPFPDPTSGLRDWIDTATAADLLDISERSVRRAVTSGRLEGRKVNGGWVIRRKDVEQYRTNRRHAA